ncbi:MAG: hypothetical protein K8R88_13165, partial [Armatimonadetes bacterium]|nr:hypothetical protein [Armatimonadota bacterium]
MPVNDVLPDIGISPTQLLDTSIDTSQIPGRTLLRLSNGTPNLGLGRLEVRGSTIISTTEQLVKQRVYRSDGSTYDRDAGVFTYHSGHGHIHFNSWCIYRLRAKNPDGSVGAILATGGKTSFCILDLQVYDNTNPAYVNPGYYTGCGSTIQGLTPGWGDVYSKGLTDQWIDITGIPDGDYFVEAEVDPENRLLESDETNNIGRQPVHVGAPPNTTADAYEENDNKAQLDLRTEGTNSPQLGVVNATKVLSTLSMQAGDDDWFRFKLNHVGGAGDYVKIESVYSGSDIDLRLYNSAGTQIGSSESGTNTEQISLSGKAVGYYYLRIWPYSGFNPQYKLTIQPSGNLPPVFNLNAPFKQLMVQRSYESFHCAWTASDPENDPMHVAFFMSRTNVFDKSAIPVPAYQYLPATDLAANINTAEMGLGVWYVMGALTDGGMTVQQVATHSVILYEKGDLNYDGKITRSDVKQVAQWLSTRRGVPRAALTICDMDNDGDVDQADLQFMESHMVP